MQTMAKLGVLLILVATACGNDSDDARVPRAPGAAPDQPDKPEATAPAAWEIELPFPLIPFDDPAREITIDADDLAPMPVIDAKDVAMPAYTVGKVGRPRELLRAKHLRLSDDSPIATNRGLVEVTDGVGFEARTLEAVLVDFQTGEVQRFADVFGTQPGLAIAWGKEKLPDGTERSVLIHPDGQTVPWIAKGTFRELTDVVVNVGRHEILLVQQNQAWRENGRGTTFARWTDLRRPPPPPTLPMPLPPQDDEPTSSLLGAYEFDALGAVRNVVARNTKLHAGCTRVEILPDNTTRCIPAADIILGDGWHLTPGEGEWIAYNEARKEIQHLRFAGACVPQTHREAPPRVLFECKDEGLALWSPTSASALDRTRLDPGSVVGAPRSGHTVPWGESWRSDNTREQCPVRAWIDLVDKRVIRTPPLRVHNPSTADRHALVSQCGSSALAWVDIARAQLAVLSQDAHCDSLTSWTSSQSLWAVMCLDSSGRARWSEIFDLASMTRWRISAIQSGVGNHYRALWLDAETRTVVWVDEGAESDRLLAWSLR